MRTPFVENMQTRDVGLHLGHDRTFLHCRDCTGPATGVPYVDLDAVVNQKASNGVGDSVHDRPGHGWLRGRWRRGRQQHY